MACPVRQCPRRGDPYLTAAPISCDTGEPVDAIETGVVAGASGLRYDPVAARYTYVWKTRKAWAGTCLQLQVKLDDGITRSADFKFL